MSKRIIECVPNFSEGRDVSKIDAIRGAIGSVAGVTVLHVDRGEAANRTVITFAGAPDAVVEGAFRGAEAASSVIDMRCHRGAHPRIGATDVLPLVPVSGVTLEECALMARGLAARMAEELGTPCYCYEAAALRPEFSNLAVCRHGEYEALQQKLSDERVRPDFMPADLSRAARTGISVVGARRFLIAVNFNLDTADTAVAKAIAREVRQKGEAGRPHAMEGVKAIGWYIDEYGIAQVSMNITDIVATPLHTAFTTVTAAAREHGVSVTGTEIIGMVPLSVLTAAGRFFLGHTAPDGQLIGEAVKRMGLDDLRPFVPAEKVIDLALGFPTASLT